jgi:hypothetical protein
MQRLREEEADARRAAEAAPSESAGTAGAAAAADGSKGAASNVNPVDASSRAASEAGGRADEGAYAAAMHAFAAAKAQQQPVPADSSKGTRPPSIARPNQPRAIVLAPTTGELTRLLACVICCDGKLDSGSGQGLAGR